MATPAKKSLSPDEIRDKIRHFCAYQERSRLQVIRKLKSLQCPEEHFPSMLQMLTEGNYLNEQRFVAQYVRSRSASKGWGPAKIVQALQRETGENYREEIRLDADSGSLALQKLDKDLFKKRQELEKKKDPFLREKLLQFCLRRGFSPEVVSSLQSFRGLR